VADSVEIGSLGYSGAVFYWIGNSFGMPNTVKASAHFIYQIVGLKKSINVL